jgi:hypothetical protein
VHKYLKKKNYPKEKQDGFGYTQGDKRHKQGRWKGGIDIFGRGGWGSLNKSTSQLNEANWSTNLTNSSNPRPKVDKTKIKCYNYEKMGHYTRDC